MEDQKRLFIESANRLNIKNLTDDMAGEIWDYVVQTNKENDVDYIPDNICYCFTDYGLNILSKHIQNDLLLLIKQKAFTATLADVIYSLCIQGVNREIANTLANTWIKRCHRIYIRTDEELKGIPKKLWWWIFDDREPLYKELDSIRICFIGKGEDLFTRVNIKSKKENS